MPLTREKEQKQWTESSLYNTAVEAINDYFHNEENQARTKFSRDFQLIRINVRIRQGSISMDEKLRNLTRRLSDIAAEIVPGDELRRFEEGVMAKDHEEWAKKDECIDIQMDQEIERLNMVFEKDIELIRYVALIDEAHITLLTRYYSKTCEARKQTELEILTMRDRTIGLGDDADYWRRMMFEEDE